MKKGPKIALAVVLPLLVIIASGVIYLGTQLDAIVAGLIEEHGSRATGTAVDVAGVRIRLRDASGEIDGLTVANPPGFSGEPAIALGHFAIRLDPSSLSSDTIRLENVTVDGARLHILQQGTANNLRTLLDNLGSGSSAAGSVDDDGNAKKIIIEQFVLDDARALVSLPDREDQREIDIPRIVLTDIGRAANGATAAAAARQILAPVLRQALRSGAAESLRDKAQDTLDDARDEAMQKVLERVGGHNDT